MGVRRHILVVINDPLEQRSWAELLRGHGHAVTVVGNGFEAQAEIQSIETFDLIFAGMTIPGINGISLLQWMREGDVRTRYIPFALLSASEVGEGSTRTLPQQCIELNAHFVKIPSQTVLEELGLAE